MDTNHRIKTANTASDCRRYQACGNGLLGKAKVGKKDEEKSDAASINLLAPRVFKNVCT